MPWADSHCHLPYERLGDPGQVIAQARAAGVERFVTIGTDAAQSSAAIGVAVEHAAAGVDIWATVGLHPHDAVDGVATILPMLAPDRIGPDRIRAVGECGLDYHYDHSPRDVQQRVFGEQISLARERDLTLVIHTREAWDDTFAILDAEGVPERTIFHCFSGGPDEARRSLDRGAWLSFSGIITFKTAGDLRAAAAVCPLDRLLVETDSPYLAPIPHRGKTNVPAYVGLVGAGLAAALGVPVSVVEDATWAGCAAAFALPT